MIVEDALHQFFLEEIDAQDLHDVLQAHQEQEDIFHYEFRDMNQVYVLEPYDLVRVCDAVLNEMLLPTDLSVIAELINRSELFEWEDELIDQVCSFWIEPQADYPLTVENVTLFRQWLKGESLVPA
jgi:hypothetical protein